MLTQAYGGLRWGMSEQARQRQPGRTHLSSRELARPNRGNASVRRHRAWAGMEGYRATSQHTARGSPRREPPALPSRVALKTWRTRALCSTPDFPLCKVGKQPPVEPRSAWDMFPHAL